jgi:hypothetical protein
VLVVLVAVVCAVRLVACAGREVWALVRRKTPRRVVWAFRGTAVPMVTRVGRIVLLYVGAAAVGAGATTWALAQETTPPTVTTPTSVSVPLSPPAPRPAAPPTTPTTPTTFARTVVPALEQRGLTHVQALLFAAHLARETGWGRWVSHHNYGNIKTGTWSGASFSLTDRRGFRSRYRAYPTAAEGIEGALALIRDSQRYRKAWSLLQRGDLHWYGQLGLDGYYEGPPDRETLGQHTAHTLATIEATQREYEGIVNLMRRYDAGGMT